MQSVGWFLVFIFFNPDKTINEFIHFKNIFQVQWLCLYYATFPSTRLICFLTPFVGLFCFIRSISGKGWRHLNKIKAKDCTCLEPEWIFCTDIFTLQMQICRCHWVGAVSASELTSADWPNHICLSALG